MVSTVVLLNGCGWARHCSYVYRRKNGFFKIPVKVAGQTAAEHEVDSESELAKEGDTFLTRDDTAL